MADRVSCWRRRSGRRLRPVAATSTIRSVVSWASMSCEAPSAPAAQGSGDWFWLLTAQLPTLVRPFTDGRVTLSGE